MQMILESIIAINLYSKYSRLPCIHKLMQLAQCCSLKDLSSYKMAS